MATSEEIRITSASEDRLGLVAGWLAPEIAPGDIIALRGALGAGKTSFCRALIRAATGMADAEVPSPTFTLAQPYEVTGGFTLWHFDLYRLEQPEEALELGIEDAFIDGASLIEWPEKLGRLLPGDHLSVALEFATAKGRRDVTLSGGRSWSDRLQALATKIEAAA